MNEHLSRMDRYGQQNRTKLSASAASWTLASGMAATEPVPEAADAVRPAAAARSQSAKSIEGLPLILEEAVPQPPAEKKPAIGDETMVRLLIPRLTGPDERRRGRPAPAVSKPESVKPRAAGDDKFESAAVAALAKLKEPVQPLPLVSEMISGQAPGGQLGDERGDSLAIPGMEPVLEMLPTRKELYPSQRLKMTRWFYNSLLYIFVIILIYLLWWGVSDSPWGKSHGL